MRGCFFLLFAKDNDIKDYKNRETIMSNKNETDQHKDEKMKIESKKAAIDRALLTSLMIAIIKRFYSKEELIKEISLVSAYLLNDSDEEFNEEDTEYIKNLVSQWVVDE